MHILDQIVANGTDASETLSPPGVGGNITEPEKVRAAFGGKVAMIGGMDQFNVLTTRHAGADPAEVRRLFEGFGKDGGYICSASDHFFETPVENLKAFAAAAKECLLRKAPSCGAAGRIPRAGTVIRRWHNPATGGVSRSARVGPEAEGESGNRRRQLGETYPTSNGRTRWAAADSRRRLRGNEISGLGGRPG